MSSMRRGLLTLYPYVYVVVVAVMVVVDPFYIFSEVMLFNDVFGFRWTATRLSTRSGLLRLLDY